MMVSGFNSETGSLSRNHSLPSMDFWACVCSELVGVLFFIFRRTRVFYSSDFSLEIDLPGF